MTPEFESNAARPFLDGYLPYLVNRLAREMLRGVDTKFAQRGLTVSKWRILAVLSDKGTCRFGELVALTSIEPPTLSRFVSSLDEDGLIERKRPKNDARTVEIKLTRKGAATFEATLPWAVTVERVMTRDLNASEVRLLKALLTKMFVNVAGASLADPSAAADTTPTRVGPRAAGVRVSTRPI